MVAHQINARNAAPMQDARLSVKMSLPITGTPRALGGVMLAAVGLATFAI